MSYERRGNWQIAYIVDGVDENTNAPTTKINAFDLLNAEDLKDYKNDKSVIFEYYNSVKMVQGVQLNIGQFLKAVVDYAGDFLDTREMHEEKFDLIALDFSRLLLNILSMFRSLLDHSDTSLSRQFGKDSQQVAKWKETLAHEYDNSFEYRFLYKLRNYSQHVGVPPIGISFSDSANQEGIGFRLDFNRNSLLEEKESWSKQLRDDLSTRPEKIPVISVLDNWSESFWKISRTLLEIKRVAAIEPAKRIVNHRIRLGFPQNVGMMCAVWFPEAEIKPQSLNMKIDWMPEQKAQAIIDDTAFTIYQKND